MVNNTKYVTHLSGVDVSHVRDSELIQNVLIVVELSSLLVRTHSHRPLVTLDRRKLGEIDVSEVLTPGGESRKLNVSDNHRMVRF